jgi:hypothetical protein
VKDKRVADSAQPLLADVEREPKECSPVELPK